MSYNAWMPLQGTTGKAYDYTTKKTEKSSRGEEKNVKNQEKEKENLWKLSMESYVPSTEAEEYKVKNDVAKKVEKKAEVKLSQKAQDLLKELKEKYSNMDFFVASYSTEREAQRYLQQGTKQYSVLIDPETLEAMANDKNVRAQYEEILSGAGDKLEELKEKLGEDADKVKNFGISINREGKVSYFAELDKISEARKEQVEKAKEKKAEEKKEAKKEEEARRKEKVEEVREQKSHFVKGDSVEELLEKIQAVGAATKGAETVKTGSFDITM